MPTKRTASRSVQVRVRLDETSHAFANERAKEGRFQTLSKYVQWLIWKERTGADGPLMQLEEKFSRSLAVVQRDLRIVHTSTEGANAFLHALAKFLVVTLHEQEGDEKKALQAKAKMRYERILTQAGRELAELLEGDEQHDKKK